MIKDKKSTFSLKKIVVVSLGLLVSINVGVKAFDIDMGDVKTVLSSDYIKISNIEDIKNEGRFDLNQILSKYPTVVEKIEKKQEPIPYETITKDVSSGSDVTESVIQEGVDGLKEITYKIKYENDIEVSKMEISSVVLVEPIAKIIQKQTVAPLASRSGTITERAGDIGEYQAYAQSKMADYVWSDYDFECLIALWTKESNWNPTAGNTSSGAYGIPQALPASKMASYGDDYLTNYETQINWGLNYIKARYENPANAWSHFLSNNWY